MISYAQNFEDVILNRAFGDRTEGFYIDVGAWDPVVDSVTKHFYDLGWSGINVEPAIEPFAALLTQRPRDLNLKVALGDRSETRDFCEVMDSGLSTLNTDVLPDLSKYGFEHVVRSVEMTTLGDLCQSHVDGPIDFIKIDVEGWEEAVIRGGDWGVFRPAVLVIEAVMPSLDAFSTAPSTQVVPRTDEPVRKSFEDLLSEHGYELCLFDGLNEFYVAEEALYLRERLSVPANVYDQFVPFRLHETETELVRAREAQEDLTRQLEECRRELSGRDK